MNENHKTNLQRECSNQWSASLTGQGFFGWQNYALNLYISKTSILHETLTEEIRGLQSIKKYKHILSSYIPCPNSLQFQYHHTLKSL